MKINKIIGITTKFLKILELYKDKGSVEEMLDNIYEDLSKANEINASNAHNKKNTKQKNQLPNSEDTIKILESFKSKEEILLTLTPLTKSSLELLATQIGLKFKSKSKKGDLISIISEHYSYKLLNEKISDRDTKS